MIINNALHKIFLISMFAVCSFAVVLFVKQKADASDSLSETTNIIAGTVQTQIITSPTISSTTPPTTTTTTIVPKDSIITSTATGTMPVSNTDVNISPTAAISPNMTTEGTAGTATGTISPVYKSSTTTSPPKNTTIITPTNTTQSNIGAQNISESVPRDDNQDVTPASVIADPEKVSPPERAPRSQIIAAPVLVEAKKLEKNKNPKMSGEINYSLRFEKVEMIDSNEGGKKISLAGRAEPNAIVTIYIFSNDPVVITIKVDADGNWNYELDKELADGQHEAYVAVTDDEGKIISKSQPIAFVKSAQAASVIPISEFNGNQSPIENATQQYVLIAIVIMSVCLGIALVAIGFLTHGRNLNEGIN